MFKHVVIYWLLFQVIVVSADMRALKLSEQNKSFSHMFNYAHIPHYALPKNSPFNSKLVLKSGIHAYWGITDHIDISLGYATNWLKKPEILHHVDQRAQHTFNQLQFAFQPINHRYFEILLPEDMIKKWAAQNTEINKKNWARHITIGTSITF
jgi:hypothetical protein